MPVLTRPVVFLCGLYPLAWTLVDVATGALGANPIEKLLNRSGFAAIVFLAATLVPTALRIVAGVAWPLKVRRMLGLFAFWWACVHLVLYAVVDQGLALDEIASDVLKRRFQAVGLLTWLVLVPLAVTSTKGWVRRLGGRTWQRLHRGTYVAAVLSVVHYAWKVKADLAWPAGVGVVIGGLLLVRVVEALRTRS